MDLSFCRSLVWSARRAAVMLLLTLAALSACKGEEQEGECAADTDCARGSICQNAVCAQIPCFTSSECPGSQQACVSVAGGDGVSESFCSAFDCLGNNDCVVAGLGLVCVDNACFDACSEDADCGDGKICSRTTQECVDAPTDCEDDNDCPDGKVCDTDISRCVDADENNENNENNSNNNNSNNNNNNVNNNSNNNNNNNGSNLPPCSPCEAADECGGDEDDCTLLDGGKFCTKGCASDADCGTGFECARNLQNSPLQCLPIGNACVGCLLPGEECGGNQVCDPESGECVTPLDNCEPCTNDAQCGDGGRCYDNNGSRVCGVACANDNSCGAGYVCSEREGARICTSLEGCEGGGETCANPPACAGDLPVLNEEFCVCVQCNADGDCNDGQVCGTNFRCYTATVSCSNPEDCTDPNAPFCQGGYCIQCVSAQDCTGNPAGEFCVGGVCGGCECPEGQTCNSNGTCVEPQGCTTDADCMIADGGGGGIPGLGAQGRCDDQGACYQVGACGDSSSFANGCGMNLTCEDVFGIFPVFACVGCTDDSQCRAGETCCPTFDGSRMVCSGIACQ